MAENIQRLPEVVSPEKWKAAREEFLQQEKELTRLRDKINARRRRLPMIKIEKSYTFEGPDGQASLMDLFNGRQQLILYHFMFGPTWDEGCVGCSMLVDGMGNPTHLHARNTSLVLVSRAPLHKIEAYKKRMGWTVPWYSSFGSDFNYDMGVTEGEDELPGHSVFLRDGNDVYRTYFSTSRGDEYLGNTWSYLDITPYGRQESWEDSPQGWPQTPPYQWWRRHDKYENT
ncbi:DUF899 domain-containing protein [Negadavirga shengliensis]|uniref:DUF899 domain-containing protein n=1 Tax=Negadavirga shengliensis TaxID=1389218 RepID=A0ABV9T6X9_9BACT